LVGGSMGRSRVRRLDGGKVKPDWATVQGALLVEPEQRCIVVLVLANKSLCERWATGVVSLDALAPSCCSQ
jgi:hypothetical protein